MAKRFSIKERIRSFRYAFSGLHTLLKEQHNARIHLIATIAVATAGFILKISHAEWIAVVLCITIVFAAEAFNSAIEYLSDFVSPERHELIKKVKDVSAAAILIIAAGAVAVGLLIFLPKIVLLCSTC